MSDLKALLHKRYELWRSQHPDHVDHEPPPTSSSTKPKVRQAGPQPSTHSMTQPVTEQNLAASPRQRAAQPQPASPVTRPQARRVNSAEPESAGITFVKSDRRDIDEGFDVRKILGWGNRVRDESATK